MFSDRDARWRLFAYLGLVVFGLLRFRAAPGDDLSASFIGCRLLAAGEGASLYDFHPVWFHVVDTPAWKAAAAAAGIGGFPHPYVQTPLWAWGLRPLCATLSFAAFRELFLALALVALAALVEFSARAWAEKFLSPKWTVVALVAIAMTTPFTYAMWLVQTHVVFLALTVAALIAADRGRAAWAGSALALAAAVKITPALLLIYWLAKGQFRAAAWFVVVSALGVGAIWLAVGPDGFTAFVASMRRLSDVLLLSFNNQSLVAWLSFSPDRADEVFNWRTLALPPALKAVSTVASVACVAAAGLWARRRPADGAPAAFALVALTAFSPIAWTHYYLALIPAAMILAERGGIVNWIAVGLIFALDIKPLAVDALAPALGGLTILRSQLLAAGVAMVALAAQDFSRFVRLSKPSLSRLRESKDLAA